MCGVSMQCFGATMRNITEQRGQANSGDGDAECDQRFFMHAYRDRRWQDVKKQGVCDRMLKAFNRVASVATDAFRNTWNS